MLKCQKLSATNERKINVFTLYKHNNGNKKDNLSDHNKYF